MSLVAWQELERSETRVLAAIRCVDATTGAPIEHNLQLSGTGASLLRNRSGLYVIRSWLPLLAHEASFRNAPNSPALGSQSLTLSITDPSGRYLPREVVVSLPRDADPANKANADSLFAPIVVPMYVAGTASVGANWATLRISLAATGSGDALGGALVRVIANGDVIARGLTDWRGEALVPVAGIPVTTWSDDPNAVIVTSITATIEARFHAASGSRVTAAALAQGRGPASPPRVNPESLEVMVGLPTVTTDVQLAAGRAQTLSLSLVLP